MMWYHWLMIAVGTYLACGIGMMFMLLQTAVRRKSTVGNDPALAALSVQPVRETQNENLFSNGRHGYGYAIVG